MLQQRSLSRRQVLQYTGITASSTLLAECSNQSDGSDDGNENGNETAPDGGSANETGENESEPNNESSNETNNGGNESNESGSNTAEWQDVGEIVLDGYTEAWEGHNILGNTDVLTLEDDANKASKIQSKAGLLEDILVYDMHNAVRIDYTPSLGDWKTAWDYIHFGRFLETKNETAIHLGRLRLGARCPASARSDPACRLCRQAQ